VGTGNSYGLKGMGTSASYNNLPGNGQSQQQQQQQYHQSSAGNLGGTQKEQLEGIGVPQSAQRQSTV
jgi:hypothetical protein